MRVGIMARLWGVCLQMFSSSRHRGFGGRKGGHVICGCNYYIIFQISHCAPYHMGPPNPKWWMGRSLSTSRVLGAYLCPFLVFLCLEGAMKKCSYRQKFSATLHQRGKSRTGDKHCIQNALENARQASSARRLLYVGLHRDRTYASLTNGTDLEFIKARKWGSTVFT